jgi:hypothetical protein
MLDHVLTYEHDTRSDTVRLQLRTKDQRFQDELETSTVKQIGDALQGAGNRP